MSAVLRIAASSLDVDAVAWVPREKLENVWRAGDKTLRGAVRADSGFSILLADSDQPDRMVRDAMETFVPLAPHVADLLRKGDASAEIDFALFVDAAEPKSVVLEPSTLRMIEATGVRIIISAYPVGMGSGD